MKLFLCGGGSGKQVEDAYCEFLANIDKRKPILYVPLAMDDSKYDDCYEWFSEEVKYLGGIEYEMVYSALELSEKELDNYSALFIGGGNTYKLLSELYSYDNYSKIFKYLDNDGVVFASSAGAIVFGLDIDSCLLDDKNIVNIKNTSGFGVLGNYSLLCHLSDSNLAKNKKCLLDYSRCHKLIYLPEEDTIFINNGSISLIGNLECLLFDNKKIMSCCDIDIESIVL